MEAGIPNTVREANIVTGIIDTCWKSFFHPSTGAFTGETAYPGDGTVIEWSAANGAASQARGAEEQHDTIFGGPVARKTIAWLLSSDVEPTKGFATGIRGALRDALGGSIPLTSIAYEAEPQVLPPGEAGAIALRLTGDAALGTADLSNIRLTLKQQSLVAVVDAATPSRNERTISAAFIAPTDYGPHVITIDIPGLTQFHEYLLVLKSSEETAK